MAFFVICLARAYLALINVEIFKMPYLFLLFITIPIVEMWLLISVGRHIGALPTITLVVATAVIGVYWLRQQGFSTLLKLNERVSAGELPAREITEGVIIAVGGALLLTPGFATDALGFACLFTPTRALFVKILFSRIQNGFMASAMSGQASRTMEGRFTATDSAASNNAHEHQVIDGEYSRDD